MDKTLFLAIFFIFAACILYSLGVWAERIQGRLKPWHAFVFWGGLISDSIGTGAMGMMAGTLFKMNFHGITGLIAILLMLFHAAWASLVLLRKNEKLILKFHRFSFIVWIIWLIPMVTGMIFGAEI